jgi:hypothetical protein
MDDKTVAILIFLVVRSVREAIYLYEENETTLGSERLRKLVKVLSETREDVLAG